MTIIALHYGLGRHIDVVSPKDQTMILKLLFFYQIFYVLAPLTVKVSALFLYKRVFVTPRFVRFVNIMLWIMAAWGLASFLVSVLNCIPVQAFWTGEGQCIVLRVWVSDERSAFVWSSLMSSTGLCLWRREYHARLSCLANAHTAYLAAST